MFFLPLMPRSPLTGRCPTTLAGGQDPPVCERLCLSSAWRRGGL